MSDSVPSLEIAAQNLKVCYEQTLALDIQRLQVGGRIVAVIGHNGSGKSTFLKSVLGLLQPRSGVLTTRWKRDELVIDLRAERDMAFSPENGAVFADVSVESYIKLWCRIKQGSGDYYRKQGRHYLEQLDIFPLLGKLGRELSKGQRRRVQTAIGFLTQPKLFLFDEPFDGLDIAQSNQLSSVILEQSQRMSMIISSHRMEVVERLADLVIVLQAGKVVTCGTVDEVCAALCGRSFTIADLGEVVAHLLPILRTEFATCLINSIGSQVSITGLDVDEEAVTQFFGRHHINSPALRPTRPSLVDAMQYHLKKMPAPTMVSATRPSVAHRRTDFT